MADISKINLGGVDYNIKDASARTSIENIKSSITGGMHFIGTTSTRLTDQATTATLAAASQGSLSKTNGFTAGDIVIYDKQEFVWNGSLWSEFGSTGSLKALAFKDSASGTVTIPATDHTHTVALPEHTHTVTQGSVSASGKFTPNGSVTIADKADAASATKGVGTGQHIATDADFEDVSIIPVGGTQSIYQVTGVGALPKLGTMFTVPNVTGVGTLPNYEAKSIPNVTDAGTMFKAEVDGETLTLTAGSAPTLGDAISVNSMSSKGTLPTLGTAFSIPNVTSVGSLPTRATVTIATAGTAKTVKSFKQGSTADGTTTATKQQSLAELLSGSFSGTEGSVSVTGSTSGVAVAKVAAKNVTSGAPSKTATPTVTVK